LGASYGGQLYLDKQGRIIALVASNGASTGLLDYAYTYENGRFNKVDEDSNWHNDLFNLDNPVSLSPHSHAYTIN
jgi:hypothetical protein